LALRDDLPLHHVTPARHDGDEPAELDKVLRQSSRLFAWVCAICGATFGVSRSEIPVLRPAAVAAALCPIFEASSPSSSPLRLTVFNSSWPMKTHWCVMRNGSPRHHQPCQMIIRAQAFGAVKPQGRLLRRFEHFLCKFLPIVNHRPPPRILSTRIPSSFFLAR